jgi:hypothetical protein
MEKFNINPCKACKLKCKGDDVNCINNCCSDTIAAFKGVSSINTIRNDPDFQNCVKCLNNSIDCLGSNTCDMRITAAPVWTQVPHYFPELLNEYKDVNMAKNSCYNFCLDCKYKNSCIQNCNTDADAVETYNKPPEQNQKKLKKDVKQEAPYSRTNPFSFYTALIIGLIIFGFIIFLFLNVLYFS